MNAVLVLLCPLLAACFLCFSKLMGGAVSSVMQHTWADWAINQTCMILSRSLPPWTDDWHYYLLPYWFHICTLTQTLHTYWRLIYRIICLISSIKTFCIIYRLCVVSLFCHMLLSQVVTIQNKYLNQQLRFWLLLLFFSFLLKVKGEDWYRPLSKPGTTGVI